MEQNNKELQDHIQVSISEYISKRGSDFSATVTEENLDTTCEEFNNEHLNCNNKFVINLESEHIYSLTVAKNPADYIKTEHNYNMKDESAHKLRLMRLKKIYEKFGNSDNPRFINISKFKKATQNFCNNRKQITIFVCKFCHYQTKRLLDLNHHLENHKVKGFPYVCNICGYKTLNSAVLKIHKRKHYKKTPPVYKFSCNLCAYNAINVTNLNKHIETHSKIYSCKSCPNQKYNKDEWKLHMKYHSTPMLVKCDICEMEFDWTCQLTQHYSNEHEQISYTKSVPQKNLTDNHNASATKRKKLYECESCELKTENKQDFIYHKITHREEKASIPFACNVCDYKTEYLLAINEHLKLHTAVVVNRCGICQSKYTNIFDFKRHLKIHKDVMPYACYVCDFRSVTSYLLEQHMAKHNT